MGSRFVADVNILRTEGNTILSQSDQFYKNIDNTYAALDEMLTSNYLSPAATALGNRIRSYKDELEMMAKTIRDYGDFCLHASNKVNRTEQNLIDSYK